MGSHSAFSGGGLAKPWRILVADDHPLFRSALRQLLCRHEDLEVVAEAATGKQAIEQCHLLRPDLVLMDIGMPEMDGITATQRIKEGLPNTVVLILTALEEPDYLLEAIKVGAAGYVLKHTPEQQLAYVVRATLRGESPLNEGLAKQLLLRLAEEQKAGGLAPPRRLPPGEHPQRKALAELTAREVETLRLLVKGRTNRDIARNLAISLSTAKQHVRHVIAKLGVSDRTQAAVKAIELGLHVEHEGR
jgi:DNA-binding NarL/FixJ family response regulator